VRADIVEASEFPALAQQYNVYAVPKTVINETRELIGALPEPDVVKALVEAATPASTASGQAPPGAAPAPPASGPTPA
jgi:hypothetical protein